MRAWVFLVVIAACKGEEMRASEYNQACANHAECVAVVEGDACDPCACPMGAINRSDEETYNARLGSARCVPGPEPSCAPCGEGEVFCVDGKCAVVVAPDGGI